LKKEAPIASELYQQGKGKKARKNWKVSKGSSQGSWRHQDFSIKRLIQFGGKKGEGLVH